MGMAKKAKKKTRKSKQNSTDWALGQPLDFPLRPKTPAEGDSPAEPAGKAPTKGLLSAKRKRK
jgi:hypothetical protein